MIAAALLGWTIGAVITAALMDAEDVEEIFRREGKPMWQQTAVAVVTVWMIWPVVLYGMFSGWHEK